MLWLAYGAVLDPKPEPRGSCITGLYPGAYGDSLVPAHLIAYLLVAGAIVWSRPPGRRTVSALAATGVVVAVSLAWSGPIAVLGIAALVASPPAAMWTAIALWLILRRGRDDLVPALLWTVLLVGLPATFMAAYLKGAGLFCF